MGFILPGLVILGIALLSGPFGIVIILAAIGGAISGLGGKKKRVSDDTIINWVIGVPVAIMALFAIVCLFYPPAMGLLDELDKLIYR